MVDATLPLARRGLPAGRSVRPGTARASSPSGWPATASSRTARPPGTVGTTPPSRGSGEGLRSRGREIRAIQSLLIAVESSRLDLRPPEWFSPAERSHETPDPRLVTRPDGGMGGEPRGCPRHAHVYRHRCHDRQDPGRLGEARGHRRPQRPRLERPVRRDPPGPRGLRLGPDRRREARGPGANLPRLGLARRRELAPRGRPPRGDPPLAPPPGRPGLGRAPARRIGPRPARDGRFGRPGQPRPLDEVHRR